jgi:hypothetical protein
MKWRDRIAAKLLRQAGAFFETLHGSFDESTPLIELAAGDWFRVINWSFEVEKKWRFEFPDPRLTKAGRERQSYAESIKDLRGYVDYIARLPGNTSKRKRMYERKR